MVSLLSPTFGVGGSFTTVSQAGVIFATGGNNNVYSFLAAEAIAVTIEQIGEAMSSSALNEIVKVTIKKGFVSLSTKAFGALLLVSEDATERVKRYGSAAEVAEDYSTTAPEYYAAAVYFSQSQVPDRFFIGQHDTTGAETITEALDAILQIEQGFYGVALLNADSANYVSTAAWCKLEKRFLFSASADANIVDVAKATDTTSLAYLLNNATANKALCVYNSKTRSAVAGEELLGYIDIAIASTILAKDPGSYTLNLQQLSSCFADVLTSSQRTNAYNKNTNIFIEIAGIDVVREGRVTDGGGDNSNPGGEWVDVEIGLDWLVARMEEGQAAILIANDKVPYTDAGVGLLENDVRRVLGLGQDNDFIDTFETNAEPVLDQDINDRQNRIYKGLTFTARLAGAVHKVEIEGTVEV